jgi:uracil-DNA glycosylase
MKPLFLLGEAYGENEAKIRRGFVGAAGVELLRMLDETSCITLTAEDHSYIQRFYDRGDPNLLDCVWNMHPEVYRSNVFNIRPPGNKLEWFCGGKKEGIIGYPALTKSKYVRTEFIPELERLADELVTVDPNLVVCLGNCALWALAGTTGISKLRGTTRLSTHTCDGFKLLPVYHPSAVLRQWELRPTTIMDLAKACREREFPEIRRPRREIWIEPTLEDIHEFFDAYVKSGRCRVLSVDIETSGNQITCIGFAPSPERAIVIPFVDYRRKDRSYWPNARVECAVVRACGEVLSNPHIHKVFQNGLYDIAFIARAWGIKVLGAEDDTMLLHHSLQPEALKRLDYLGSIYGQGESAWKAEHRASTIKRDA